MKKSIQTLLLIFVMYFPLYCQPYEAIIDADSTSWDIAGKELFGNIMGNLYTVANDDTDEHELYFTGDMPVEYVGKISEDISTGRIWYEPAGASKTESYLIMDLTLSIGDIFDLPVYSNTIPIEVVDVYYINQRKFIEFDYQTQWDEPLLFIEGVGRNIAMHHFWFYDKTYVACKYNDEELVYVNSNPNFIDCNLDPSGISHEINDLVSVFPNPATNRLFIEIPSSYSSTSELTLYNSLGEAIYRQRFTDFTYYVNLTNFDKGLYFLGIKVQNNYFTTKIIKQ